MIGDFNTVNVQHGHLILNERIRNFVVENKCEYCKSDSEFTIFADDGKPTMARLFSTVCKEHLAQAVIEATKYNVEKKRKAKFASDM